MTAAGRSLATALWTARFASGLLPQSYTNQTGHDLAKGLSVQIRRAGSRLFAGFRAAR
jgi:hypothetical protein